VTDRNIENEDQDIYEFLRSLNVSDESTQKLVADEVESSIILFHKLTSRM